MQKPLPFRQALVLAPHTDDEMGCAGAVLRLLRDGACVHAAVFSSCAESVPEGFPPDTLRLEHQKAMAALGIAKENVTLFDFRVRHFPAHRQEILEAMVQLRKKLEPDLVLLPGTTDIHQDHQTIAEEGLRCFKHSSVLGYELPWNQRIAENDCFFEMSQEDLERKIASLGRYESQRFRPYASGEFFRALARVRGVQAGVELAEAFQVLRLKL
jgi:N-acetylglucosamine malate deacetylase 1